MLRHVSRARRYLGTYAWLTSRQFAYSGTNFVIALVLGVGGRLGNLVGMMVTLKALTVMVLPEQAARLTEAVPIFKQHPHILTAVLILAPTLILVISAICQWLSTHFVSQLKREVSLKLAGDLVGRAPLSTKEPAAGRDSGQFGTKTDVFVAVYRKVYRVEHLFIALWQGIIVLGLATLIGLYLNFKGMAVVGLLFLLFLAIFVSFRQSHALRMRKEFEALRKRERDAIAEAQRIEVADPNSGRAGENMLPGWKQQVADSIHESTSKSLRFSDRSHYISGLAQGLVMAAILAYVATRQFSDAHEIAMFIFFIIIIRFAFGTVQGVGQVALALAHDYQFLVDSSVGRIVPSSLHLVDLSGGIDDTEYADAELLPRGTEDRTAPAADRTSRSPVTTGAGG